MECNDPLVNGAEHAQLMIKYQDLEQSLKDALARIAKLDKEIEVTDCAICMLDEYDRWFRDGSIFVLTVEQIKKAWNNSGTKHESGKLLVDYRKGLK